LSLTNKHIILTHYGSKDSFNILKNFGANLYHFPMINIITNSNVKPFNISNFDYYIFTSKNGVDSFFSLDFVKDKKISAFCLGDKTKSALVDNGINPIFASTQNYADNLIADLLANQLLNNKKILLVLGNLADNKLSEGLSSICNVERLNVYRTNLETSVRKEITTLIENKNTISTFTSPSAFKAFYKMYNPKKTTLVSIGKTTSNYIKSLGFSADIISKKQTYDGISKEIINYYETKKITK
tara:strand:+ start:451 stop:1176 length:726 start_codon:yes stop_codon:yes gene_type:complete